MKRVLSYLFFLFMPLHLVYAGGYESFHEALTLYGQSKYSQAKPIFEACLLDPVFEEVKGNINAWIVKCDAGIQEQLQNAQAAEKRRQAKLAQRKENGFVYISVNGTETGEFFSSTESAMSEVMRLNGKRFCPNIDDALTVVTVNLNIKTLEPNNGFYKAIGSGVVRLGSAIDEKEFVGQWSVDCEATSAVNMDDAKRLLTNKLNHKLSYALDNLLNKRPQSSDYYIPEQSIIVYFASNNIIIEDSLSYLRESMNGYITKTPGMTLSTALDKDWNADRDEMFKRSAQYVKMESRAPIHELEGFEQVLRISVKKSNVFYTFTGEITEIGTGKSLTTIIVNGEDFNITDLSAKNQELAAKILAVGLGFKQWEIGEDIGGYKLALFDGMHGIIMFIPDNDPQSLIMGVTRLGSSIENISDNYNLGPGWRYPYYDELERMKEYSRKLNLTNVYWTADIPEKGKHKVADFRNSVLKADSYNDKKGKAIIVIVKDF